MTSTSPQTSRQDRLRVLFCDHLNLARGKILHGSKIGHNGEARFCRSTFGVTFDKDLIPAPGAGVTGGLPDMAAHYLASDIRPGWDANSHVVVASLNANDGSPLPLCGRRALQRAVADWQGLGYTDMLGMEHVAPDVVTRRNQSSPLASPIPEALARQVAEHYADTYLAVAARFPDKDLRTLWPSSRFVL